jgi:hypothetical protein
MSDFVGSNLSIKIRKSRSEQFWKYISQFRKTNTDLMHLEINGVLINKPLYILRYFQQIFSLFRVVLAQKPYLLLIILRKIYHRYISNSDVYNAIRWLRPTESV